ALVLVVQFFIGSASAKAFLIMPLLIPLVSIIGISKELAILAFVFGDGYTNVIFPTNAVLLIGLSIASVPYTKWFKWTAVLQVITLLLTTAFLLLGLLIGY
ncbi:MAG TPA: AbgT family transporter, partial [Bacilli bacterium]|nr:AbgT family transporter [Bacilli bacterium]